MASVFSVPGFCKAVFGETFFFSFTLLGTFGPFQFKVLCQPFTLNIFPCYFFGNFLLSVSFISSYLKPC